MAQGFPTDLDFVTRFVCMGSEEGCYSVRPEPDFVGKIPSLNSFLTKEQGLEVVHRLRAVFEKKSFVTKEPLLFALAMIVRNMPVAEQHVYDSVRNGAYHLIQDVCDSPMDLFTFISFDKAASNSKKTSWGRGLKRVVSMWYESKTPIALAHEVTKCKSGRGWTHRDLIRQSHIPPNKRSKGTAVVLNYLAHGKKGLDGFKDSEETDVQELVAFLSDIEKLIAVKVEEKDDIRGLVEKHKLTERQIPSHLFQVKETFEALLGHAELVNIFRSIPKMAALGMLDHTAPEATKVLECVGNFEEVKKQKVSPVVIYIAQRKYIKNKSKKWEKNVHIVRALVGALKVSLQCLPRIGKRILVAIHIDSRKSKYRVLGASFLTPMMPCALMTKFFIESEGGVQAVYFHDVVNPMRTLSRNPDKPTIALEGIIQQISKFSKQPENSSYDLTSPLLWATEAMLPFDSILIMSNKKQVRSKEEFHDALKTYRHTLSLPATKLAFIGLNDDSMIGNKFDLNMLEVSGFNERVPPLIYDFFRGCMDFPRESCAQVEGAAAH